MSLAAGTRLGPYEVLGPIGAGGMGEVYKARDTRLDRTVAIKVSKEKFSERFEREARSIAALNHPHICTLHDIGPNYLVMEYIEGSSLKGPLPLDQALKYAGQILSALDAAHRKGITHRDLKPGNILVTKQGIKLLDFGLAHIAASSGDETVTMAVMGTPAYMSPEQWEGRPGDTRSDIYAIGCVLYEMLTCKRVVQERTAVEPAALNSIISTCLEKDPDDRWQSARDVKSALALVQVQPAPQAAARRWRERAVRMAAAVAAVAALWFFSLWRARAPASGGELWNFAIYPPDKTVFSADINTTVDVPKFAMSPDGRTIVFSAESPGARPMLGLRPMEQSGPRVLPGTEDAHYPFWSPDSRWIGFFSDGKVKKIPAAGGAVQVVAQSPGDFRGGTWGPDDTIVFATGSQPLQRVHSAGGPVSLATSPEPLASFRHPQFLPDGSHLIYLRFAPEQSGLYAGSLDGKTKKLLLRINSSAIYAPPGYLLFVDGDTLLGQMFDAERLEPSGQPFLVAEHVGHTTAFESAVSASRTGVIAHARTIAHIGRLTWFDRRGNALRAVGTEGDYTDFRLSPDERSLAVSWVDAAAGTVDVWLNDLTRGTTSRVTHETQLGASVIWSPDGTHIAYRAIRNGQVEFHERSAGGGGDEQAVLTPETRLAMQVPSVNLLDTDWSPDGRYILFSVPGAGTGNDLWRLPLGGDRKPEKYLATPAEEIHGNFSPDGHLVAYTSNESGRFEVYVQTFPQLTDLKKHVSTDGGYEPRWRADGREIYYLSEDRKLMAVSVGPGPSFGVPQALFQTRVPPGVTANRGHYVPSRDGQRFLVNTESGDAAPTPITVVLNWTAGLKK